MPAGVHRHGYQARSRTLTQHPHGKAETGSVAAAAYELGISETTARQLPPGLYRRTGCGNAAQAAYWLGTGRLDSRAKPGSTALALEGPATQRPIRGTMPAGGDALARRAYGT